MLSPPDESSKGRFDKNLPFDEKRIRKGRMRGQGANKSEGKGKESEIVLKGERP
jgi:hypothetical protein